MNKLKKRAIESRLSEVLSVMPVVVLSGARQTGKTTLVRDMAPSENRAYYSLDYLELLDQFRKNPDSMLAHDFITIDEIQREPSLLLAIKRRVDSSRTPGFALLTGSANLSLLGTVAESLSGRAFYLDLLPFCPLEWTESHDWPQLLNRLFSPSFDIASWPCMPATSWPQWAHAGGFPPALACARNQRHIWFQGYVQTYIERDLRSLRDISNLSDFQRFMRLAALRCARLLNQSELGRDAALSQPTAHRYTNLLEATYQIALLTTYSTNPTTSLVKSKKIFWRDSGLAAWLSGVNSAEAIVSSPVSGFWFEQAFFQTLAVWESLDPPKRRIYYWRDRGGHEVDFILENAGSLVAIEMKSGEKVDSSDCRGIAAFRDALGRRKNDLKRSVIFHTGSLARPLGNEIYALPAGCFFPPIVGE